MGRLAVRLLLLIALVSAMGLAAYAWVMARFDAPGPLAKDTTLVLPKGTGVGGIAERLWRAGVIDEPIFFVVGVRLSRAERRLKAGEYVFPAGISPRRAMEIVLGGRTVVRRLTVAEGLTTAQVLALVAATKGLAGEAPSALAEGVLLPETYHFSHGDSRVQLVARMRRAMDETLDELCPTRAPELPFDDRLQALILASIVEKETGLADERAHIAGVFVNRLRRGMRLQSDPTVAYDLTAGKAPLERPLTRADLERPSPFNTYLISGLPPHPIANPGRAAIAAVLNPLATKDLYFVADGSGGHAFARTLREHQRNVSKWRRLKRQ